MIGVVDRETFKNGMYRRLDALPFVNGVRQIQGSSASNPNRFFEAWEYEDPHPYRYFFIGSCYRGPDPCDAHDIDDDVVWREAPPQG